MFVTKQTVLLQTEADITCDAAQVGVLTWTAADGMSSPAPSPCTGLVAMKLAETGGGGGVKAGMGGGWASWQPGLEQA